MLEIGTLLQDRFLIEERIGSGGMGAVYLATDQKFGSRVAIKQTIYDNLELANAFQREARLLNSLHHPVLPHVSDFFSQDGELVLVMEYIEGDDLSDILKRGESFAIYDVVRWTLELLDALDYLHSQDPPIIHRDIKPNNLKLTPRGNIVLLDFGLAKETSGTTMGMRSVFGYSRRYSPLEQIEGTGTDTRSDIFSLGATVFHLLTGEPPIDVLARASAIVAGRPDPLKLASEVNTAVPSAFSAVIKSALSLNPDDRFVSAAAMRAAIEFAADANLIIDDGAEPEIMAVGEVAGVPEAPPSNVPATTTEAEPLIETYTTPMVNAAAGTVSKTMALDRPARSRSAKSGIGPKAAISRLVPLFAAIALLAISVIGFGIYRSREPIAPKQSVTAGSTASMPAGAENEPLANNSIEPAVTSSDIDASETNAGADERQPSPSDIQPKAEAARSDKVAKIQTPTLKRVERETAEIAERPAAERPRVVKTSPPKRQSKPRQSDRVPVYTIESIFTGRPAGWRSSDVSNEERMRRRRIHQMRRDGVLPPY